jgi:hypothetical protein
LAILPNMQICILKMLQNLPLRYKINQEFRQQANAAGASQTRIRSTAYRLMVDPGRHLRYAGATNKTVGETAAA